MVTKDASVHMSSWCSEVTEKQIKQYEKGRLSPSAALGQEK